MARSPARQLIPDEGPKQPFDIDVVVARIREAIRPYPPAALFGLAGAGFGSLFEQLVACIISIRTRDEVTLPVALQLFHHASTPSRVAGLTVDEIDTLIAACSFHQPKARQIRDLAVRTRDEFGGVLPCDDRVLRSFAGVGPKCSNLVLGTVCGQLRIAVDIHVHRVTNRWGVVQAPTPERTLEALEAWLPTRYWVEINRLLVPFGKHICTGQLPRCSTCPILKMCQQRGVTAHR